MIEHQIRALAEAGVTDIVLAVNYRPEVMVNQLKKYETEVWPPTTPFSPFFAAQFGADPDSPLLD